MLGSGMVALNIIQLTLKIMNKLQHSANEKELMAEQDGIKKHLTCVAVYDLPLGMDCIPTGSSFDVQGSPDIYVTKYNKDPKQAEYKLFIYKDKN